MKLFLASEAENQETLSVISDWLGELRNSKILLITTPANGEGYGCWRDSPLISYAEDVGLELQICQLEDYKISPIDEMLEKADAYFMVGGMSGYALYWLYRTGAAKIIKRRVLEESVPYIGSSSGAMLIGQTMDCSEHYPHQEEVGALVFPPLRLVDFDIFPHYEDKYHDAITSFYAGPKLYLLRNGEYITVSQDEVSIHGIEKVIIP